MMINKSRVNMINKYRIMKMKMRMANNSRVKVEKNRNKMK